MPSRSTCTTGEMLGLLVFCGNGGSALAFISEAASKAASIVQIIPSRAALLSSCAGIPALVVFSRHMATNRTTSGNLRPAVTLSIWSDFHCSKFARAHSLQYSTLTNTEAHQIAACTFGASTPMAREPL